MNNVYSPSRDPTTDQSDNTTKLQLVEPANTSVLLTGTGTWMTQRQPHHQKLTPAGVIAHKSWNPGTLCMASRKLSVLECLLFSAALTAYITLGREKLLKQLCFRNFLKLVHCSPPPSLNIRGNCLTIRTVVLPGTLSGTRFLALAQVVSITLVHSLPICLLTPTP